MELKVWVEGIQRIVCGVTETTTCQDIVYALAHATGRIGRFTLIEKWRNNEKLLAPTDNPLKILMKWGEYSNDVQFILQHSDSENNILTKLQQPQSQQQIARQNLKQFRDDLNNEDKLLKNINFNNLNDNKEVGIVKGVPQIPVHIVTQKHERISSQTSTDTNSSNNSPEYAYVTKKRTKNNNNINNRNNNKNINLNNNNNNNNNTINTSCNNNNNNNNNIKNITDVENNSTIQIGDNHFNSVDIRNSLEKKINLYNENILEVFVQNNTNSNNDLNAMKTPIGISSNGALVPPPYRDPPPPRTSPLNSNNSSCNQSLNNSNSNSCSITPTLTEVNDVGDLLMKSTHYKDLIQLIKYQREKINMQQSDLTKYDAEIVLLESKERDQIQQLEAITREITKVDQCFRQGSEQLQSLQYIEEENEIVRQQEKTLKSEITLLRSKLANCETELLQCKNKIRLLMDEIQLEQRVLNRHYDNRQQLERHFFTEVDKIQSEIDHAIQNADSSGKTSDNLKQEVAVIENAIAEKKKQVEQLVNEMKEANLKSLAVTPPEEIKHFLESTSRPATQRKIIGSPRQLENAVPTSKNPHGVWV